MHYDAVTGPLNRLRHDARDEVDVFAFHRLHEFCTEHCVEFAQDAVLSNDELYI